MLFFGNFEMIQFAFSQWINTFDRGLSKSRNLAIRNSDADICMISDDDLVYVDDYEEIVKTQFELYPDADIITFQVEGIEEKFKDYHNKMRKLNYLTSMKVSSVEIAFKRSSIVKNNIYFDENFGAGAKYQMGEENIFLTQCIRMGLKVIYIPIKIADLHMGESSWFKGCNKDYFISKGAQFTAMSRLLSIPYIIQFALRKHKLYRIDMNLVNSLKYMFQGRKEYLKFDETKKLLKNDTMKIFFLGDFKSNTGPAIANKLMKKGLSDIDNTYFSDANNLITRIFEVLINIIRFDKICICSFSKMNYIAISLAKMFKKDIFYIMHGYASYEISINNINESKKKNDKLIKLEKYTIKNSKKVFCVSKKFMEFMIEKEPGYSLRFDYNYNGVDIDKIEKETRLYKGEKKKNQIVSIGGGMRRKNNLTVCKAINILNSEYGLNLKYVVIGLPYTDKNEICKYEFVEYYDYLPHDTVLQILGLDRLH